MRAYEYTRMAKQELHRNTEAVVAALSASNLSPSLQLAHPTRGHQNIHIAQPAAPRRQVSFADRIKRAAERIAELEFWRASGGDFLSSAQAPELIRAYQARFI